MNQDSTEAVREEGETISIQSLRAKMEPVSAVPVKSEKMSENWSDRE